MSEARERYCTVLYSGPRYQPPRDKAPSQRKKQRKKEGPASAQDLAGSVSVSVSVSVSDGTVCTAPLDETGRERIACEVLF